jgi:hypothetical protein
MNFVSSSIKLMGKKKSRSLSLLVRPKDSSIVLGWKDLPVTNSLSDFSGASLLKNGFIKLAPRVNVIKLFSSSLIKTEVRKSVGTQISHAA